ncbi:hypothetical protein ACVBEF_20835 [Glaciimonas sp. GG7]
MPTSNFTQQRNNLTDIKQRFFLIDYVKLLADASQGINTIVEVIEANEFYQSKPHRDNAEAQALALSAEKCQALQTLALLSARLLSTYAAQEVELMDAGS